MLTIKNLSVSIDDKNILNNINLQIKPGKIHVLMGPNGAGKTTLAQILIGNPNFQFSIFNFQLNGKNMVQLSTEKRARMGLFVSFQNPVELEGISVLSFAYLIVG